MKETFPPHSVQAEQAIIGSCLVDPINCVPAVQLVFTSAEFFYDMRCRTVWNCIAAIKPQDVNSVTVFQALKDAGTLEQIGGLAFLDACDREAFSPANLPAWIQLVQEKKILRDIITTCHNAITEAYSNTSAVKVLDAVESAVLKIRPGETTARDIRSLVQEAIGVIEQRATNWDLLTGLSTGLGDLDRKTDGLHEGEFIVIGAPTSCGKTALALNIIVHNALAGFPAAFLSAEMTPVKLVVRSLCSSAQVNFKRISESDVASLTFAAGRIANAPIYVDNVNGYSIGQIRAYARKLKQQHGIKLLAVENIQLLTGEGDNREQEIADISRGLKAIAMELRIPVIGLSQLNDEGRLRESRAIGHDADSVWILANEGEWQAHTQPVKLTVEKCRDGETGVVNLIFRKEFTKFEQAAL